MRTRLLLALAACLTLCSTGCRPATTGDHSSDTRPHPLDALTADEIRSAVAAVQGSGKFGAGSRFVSVALREPPKEQVLSGAGAAREALVVIYDAPANLTSEAVVDLAARRVKSWTGRPGAQAPLDAEDSIAADRIVRRDPRWRSAMRQRGILNLSAVTVLPLPAGYFAVPGEERRRVARAVSFYRGLSNNLFARPVEGVLVDVDLTAGKVIRFMDSGAVPVASDDGKIRGAASPRASRGSGTTAPFTLAGREVHWRNWRFRFGMHPREGVVLYLVGFEDQRRLRSVLYRASLSEMAVPYGDPDPAWFFRTTFDAGELGMGTRLLPFEPGVNCPPEAALFDAFTAEADGSVSRHPGAVALFERWSGAAWRYEDASRSGRELVLTWFSNLGNYDYGFEWVFREDGAIEMRVLLTGVMSVKGVKAGAGHNPFGHLVAPNLMAIHHQHFFCFRLDFDIDGPASNRVTELNAEALRGEANRYHTAFAMTETPLRSEKQAQRQLNFDSSRRWKITNESVRNALGQAPGYLLLPGENTRPFAQPESWFRRRAGFLNAALWVTPYRAEEIYAAGDYPNQSRGGEGLVQWTAADRKVDGSDVVVWYTFGVTHLPRPEDWPVMPVYEAGFRLLPCGFFSRNPLLEGR